MSWEEQPENPCHPCTKCCGYVTVPVRVQDNQYEYDYLMWLVLHDGVNLDIDEKGVWHAEFKSRCTMLDEEGLCKIYENRPSICRDYDRESCEGSNKTPRKYHFENGMQLEIYYQVRGII